MARNFTNKRTRSRPNRAWTGAVDLDNNITTASTKTLIASFVLSNSNIDETILRTLGLLTVRSDQDASSEDQQGAFGMIVVSDTAVAAGAASIPGPLTDIADDGWFVHVPFNERFLFKSATGVNPDMNHQYQFDFKSKRVIEDGSSIALMVETSSGSEGILISLILRMLSMVRGTG